MTLRPEVHAVYSHGLLAHEETLLREVEILTAHPLYDQVFTSSLELLELQALGAKLVNAELRHLLKHEKLLLQETRSLLGRSPDVRLELLGEGLVVHGEHAACLGRDNELLRGLDFYVEHLLAEHVAGGVFVEEDG